MINRLQDYYRAIEHELTGHILPFYKRHLLDHEYGGFFGHMSHDGVVHKEAAKGVIQCARLLWTYSHAYRDLDDSAYLDIAHHAYRYLLTYLCDREHGGLFWAVDRQNQPLNRNKLTYAQAFGIYGLTEFYLATGDPYALQHAIQLYQLLEQHAMDSKGGGYWEACYTDWQPAHDIAVDEVSVPVTKSMNTHLHLLEAYTNLWRAAKGSHYALTECEPLKKSLRELISITIKHIIDPVTYHFKLHFDQNWQSLSDRVSYGHDIEGSWLLWEAALVLGDSELLGNLRSIVLQMAHVTLAEGVDEDGGLFDEGNSTCIINHNKTWWSQAEAMVGFMNAYQLSKESYFLDASLASWDFINRHLIDKPHGEWHWGVTRHGIPLQCEKAGMWKTPYHNGRACLELMRRIESIFDDPPTHQPTNLSCKDQTFLSFIPINIAGTR